MSHAAVSSSDTGSNAGDGSSNNNSGSNNGDGHRCVRDLPGFGDLPPAPACLRGVAHGLKATRSPHRARVPRLKVDAMKAQQRRMNQLLSAESSTPGVSDVVINGSSETYVEEPVDIDYHGAHHHAAEAAYYTGAALRPHTRGGPLDYPPGQYANFPVRCGGRNTPPLAGVERASIVHIPDVPKRSSPVPARRRAHRVPSDYPQAPRKRAVPAEAVCGFCPVM